jgi:ABC-2 type transport system ATP-binding protein
MRGIEVESLSKSYRRGPMGGHVQALDGVTLTIAPGEVFGIIGPNGAGKTTFLGCLLGFLRPNRGRVTIDGHAPDDLSIRRVTGYLPERLVLDRWMSGFDFLMFHHALAQRAPANRRGEAEAALATVGLDGEAGFRPIRKYSRGMLQRLGLAQALLGQPRFVFLDEPASGVDPAGVVLFRRLLAGLKGRDVTVVLNSHQLDQVERLCDRVAFVKGGRVEAIETVAAGATAARILRVRWTATDAPIEDGRLRSIAADAGAERLGSDRLGARFAVLDDAAAARVLQRLVAAGIPVIEAVPEEGRLERLFLETEPPAPADAAGTGAP